MCEDSNEQVNEQVNEQKKVYILLTKQTDPFSRFSSIISGSRYLHASIGFEERGTFFSFNTKRGFCIEQPAIKRQFVPCALYSLDVTDEIYKDIEERIRKFQESTVKYRFNYFGMFWAIFRVPLKIPFVYHNSYFCTMFVSEIISQSGAIKLKFKPYRYLPRHFSHEPKLKLCFEGVWGSPPKFSEDGGDLFSIPVLYAKRYIKRATRRTRVTVKTARRTATRTVRIARRKVLSISNKVFRAPGAFYVICRNNVYTATKHTLEAIEKWWLS